MGITQEEKDRAVKGIQAAIRKLDNIAPTLASSERDRMAAENKEKAKELRNVLREAGKTTK